MSTVDQTERVNRVVEDALRSVCAEIPKRWNTMLPPVEFAMNNTVHSSTGYAPFYVNRLINPCVPLTPPSHGSGLGGEGIAKRLADFSSLTVRKEVYDFLFTRLSVLRHVRVAIAERQDMQQEYADGRSRGNAENFEVKYLVLLNAKNHPTHAVSVVFKTTLRPLFIEPFKVVANRGFAYTPNLRRKMRTHPEIYVGLIKPHRDPAHVNAEALTSSQRLMALDHPEAEPATGFEHRMQQFSFPTAKGALPSHRVTHSSARRLGAAPTQHDNPQHEAVGTQSAPSSRCLSHSDMLTRHDAQQSPYGD
ncbi:FOG: Transposon-encoded proteins with TYA, reverse transcriptase, integrase domains in various combinations [Plasmopara halstedii]|uniref:FOG: Transposon-encoded proteins with TYA, reverse transcriptase, integrase domains in various combinations n=1 Tax=Plasmopara halstedii TaxID=4781 RepID=A0A0P1AJA2_PLAHL|nr:FOG: Transposon-encoded proteins with TYA, reverse transcriptase, integrase domains in various combinations [Plasmopara halstedii]CEG40605.1 FOG: Transposon-encoded proteins with TYA, reverse transcriptase, integrase domains in various combinations [Plasmopara halstedii]|eukprot:XP_024576974.1 FOG: Transposon-encoded proteins with TYA, reverse transcriptase, integrase domains in various combinations [Plasmopara halstedii]